MEELAQKYAGVFTDVSVREVVARAREDLEATARVTILLRELGL